MNQITSVRDEVENQRNSLFGVVVEKKQVVEEHKRKRNPIHISC